MKNLRTILGLALAFLITAAPLAAGAHDLPGHKAGMIFLGTPTPPIPPTVFDPNPGFIVNSSSQIGTAPSTALGGVADTKTLTVVWWSNSFWDPTLLDNTQNNILLGQSPGTFCEHGSGNAAPGICLAFVDASGSGNFAQLNLNDSSGTGSANGIDFNFDSAIIPGVWTANIYSVDTHNQVIAEYRNRSRMTNTGGSDPAIPLDMIIPLSSSNGLGVMNRSSSNSKWEMLENFYVSTESWVCTSTADLVLNGNHFPCPGGISTIPPTLLDKVVDSSTLKAIDMGSDGSGVTGRRPEVLLSGNATSSVVNKGFATGIGLQAAVGNTGGDQGIWESPYGPGQTLTAHEPTSRWMPAAAFGSNVTSTYSCVSTACTLTAKTGGQPVVAGDQIVIAVEVVDGVAANHLVQCPSGFTSANAGPVFDASSGISTNLCYETAPDTTSSWLVPFTNSTSAFAGYVVMVYSQTASIDMHSCAVQTGASTWTTPAANTASNNEAVLSVFFQRDTAGRFFTTIPATLRWHTRISTSVQGPMITEAFYPTAGSAVAKSASFATGTDDGVVCSLGLVGS